MASSVLYPPKHLQQEDEEERKAASADGRRLTPEAGLSSHLIPLLCSRPPAGWLLQLHRHSALEEEACLRLEITHVTGEFISTWTPELDQDSRGPWLLA